MQDNGLKVVGLKQLLNDLDAIGAPAAEIKAAGVEAGDIVASEARSLAPVKSGKLRATIKTAKLLRKVEVRAGNNRSVPYANPIHWGWFYDRDNFVQKNIMPNPFLAKALGITRNEVLKTYNDNIQKLLNRYKKY
jgi:HK97 gp10 family phage protein